MKIGKQVWVLSVLLLSGGAAFAADEVITAKIYEAGSDYKNLLFNEKRVEKKGDDQKIRVVDTFTDPQGHEAYRHEATLLGDEGKFLSYTLEQKQTGDRAQVDARDGKLYFSYTEADGKTKTDSEKIDGTVANSLNLRRVLERQWKEIMAGKDVELRWVVPDRKETVGFKVYKDSEAKLKGKDVVVLIMKPTSMIIRALVKPLTFYFEKSGKLLEIHGRVLPKRKDGSDWKDLDAVTVYE